MEIVVTPMVAENTGDFSSANNTELGDMRLMQKDGAVYLFINIAKPVFQMEDLRILGGEVRKYVVSQKFGTVTLQLNPIFEALRELPLEKAVQFFMEGWFLASYSFDTYKRIERQAEFTLRYDFSLYKNQLQEAKVQSNAVNIARDLCNEPANKLTPQRYAEKITEIFQYTNVAVEIFEAEDLTRHGLEAIKMVGKGSVNPPKMAVLTLKNSDTTHVGLVGKGVTFDSGGINTKTGKGIWEMKMDMGGSAAVVGAMKLLADLDSPVHVTAVIPLVENLAGTNAYLPSDVIRYKNGLHVEVGNTDAEGRLVLADGMLYVQSIGATTVIDVATLTGAIGQALGLKTAGIFSNREEDLWAYKELGEQTGDDVWPMPLIKDYQDYMKSDYADLNNMSSSNFGGAITAAIFLSNFVEKDIKWVHIDMANTVRPWKQYGYHVKGATGFGVRLLKEIVCREGE